MKTLLLTLFLAFTALPAHAAPQCLNVGPGTLAINHRTGYLYGSNFFVQVACTRYAPVIIFQRGGRFCAGGSFYGRNFAGQPYSCRMYRIGRR